MNSPPVISNFESSCATYDANAHIQTIAANWLLDLLAELQERIPPGDALELGCGTGVFSSSLLSVCRGRRITFSDASERLLETCRTRIGMAQRSTDTSFERLDINALPEQPGRLALIASSFVLQWADNFEVCLETLSNWLVPGGYLFFSVPTNESFSEWQRVCALYNLKYTANHLPNEEQIIRTARRSGLSSRILTNSHTIRYKDARSFFRSLKLTGSHTRVDSSEKPEAANPSLWPVIRAWNESTLKPIDVSYHIAYGYLRKPKQ